MKVRTLQIRHRRHKKTTLSLVVFLSLMAALVVVACAPRQVAPGETGGVDKPDVAANMPVWSLESDCLSCHSLEATSADDATTLYGFHTTSSADQTCVTCHNEEEILVKVHENKSATSSLANKLTKTQVSSDQCLGCHNLDKIAAATAEVTVLTDTNGKTVNPHQLPQNSDHEAINCSDCHKMHTDKTLLPKTAMETCTTCHHEKVFECGTCH